MRLAQISSDCLEIAILIFPPRPDRFEPAGSEVDLTSWGNLALENEERRNEQKLEIVEVFTVPSTTEPVRQRVRTTFRPRAPTLAPLGFPISSTTRRSSPFQESMENLLEMSTKKHPTNRDDISAFFGTDDDTGDSAPVGDTFLGGRGSVNQQSAERDSSPTSVLGLFEKMRRMHSQAKENFEVVELPTKQQHEDFEEVSQQEEQERFQALQEQLRQRQVEG